MIEPHRFENLIRLGSWFSDPASNWSKALHNSLTKVEQSNGWFTSDQVLFAVEAWGRALAETKLHASPSLASARTCPSPRTVGLISAGNIPLVGLHDLLCLYASGNAVLWKPASEDSVLPSLLLETFAALDPHFSLTLSNGKWPGVDALIATGSNNTSRYFEAYFGHVPRIIRNSRTSIALLTGDEQQSDLKNLGEDVFRYFGLGCRNVTQLWMPRNQPLDEFFAAISSYGDIIHHRKYANNYDYQRAVFLLNRVPFLDNNFLLVRENENPFSPVGVLHVWRYADKAEVLQRAATVSDNIQCWVGDPASWDLPVLPFGEAQKPTFDDFADGLNTLSFLSELC